MGNDAEEVATPAKDDETSRAERIRNVSGDREALRTKFYFRFDTYRHNVVAARLLAKIGYRYLGDLPVSLPPSEIAAFRATLRRSLEVGLQWTQESEEKWVAVSPLRTLDEDGSAADIFELASAYKEERADKRFVRHVALEQCVVNAFAQFDALLQDVVEIIATVEPRALASSRQITHAEVVRHGEWGALMRHISQKFLAEFGRENFGQRLDILEERFGLRLDLSKELLSNVLVGEQARHLFTHTGGIVSLDFLRQTGRLDYEVGDKIEISVDYCNQLTDALLHIGALLRLKSEEKYFDRAKTSDAESPASVGLQPSASESGLT
jgi:hypothetical protein